MSQKKNPKTTTALPTAEEIRHQYGEAMSYVKALAAKAKRSADRKGNKDKSKATEEDLQVILNGLSQALSDDVKAVDAGKKPFSHDDLKDIMRKRYSTFADLASDYFGDDEDDDDDTDSSDSAKDKDKPKAYYLIGCDVIAADNLCAAPLLIAAMIRGEDVQLISYNDVGLPVVTTLSEDNKSKKPKKSDDLDDADTTTDDDDGSDDDTVKKLEIKFGGRKFSVPVITRTSGSGKNKKTRTYALAAADGSEVFTSFAAANDYDDPVVWHELARVMIGVKADGSDKFSYELATASPHKIKYLG